ncbi:unnamed protein product [Orchesella dallaii]|uniref:Uncharacterized protein n=1 Tax=Orchesella dallaii TaxID=48710 RepID=A0ABP1QEN4_9HEXA
MERWQICGNLVGDCGRCLAQKCYYIQFGTGHWNCVDRLTGWKDIDQIIRPIFPQKCETILPSPAKSLLAQMASENTRFSGTIFDILWIIQWMDVFLMVAIVIIFFWVFFQKERQTYQPRPAITGPFLLTTSPPPSRRRIRVRD